MPDWVTAVSECISADSELAGLSSCNTAVAEVLFLEWFGRRAYYYPAHASCRSEFTTLERWILAGAGMTMTWKMMKMSWSFEPKHPPRDRASATAFAVQFATSRNCASVVASQRAREIDLLLLKTRAEVAVAVVNSRA